MVKADKIIDTNDLMQENGAAGQLFWHEFRTQENDKKVHDYEKAKQ